MSHIDVPAAGAAMITELKKVGISVERVVVWTLVFTNAFFVSYFFARLFGIV
jgi:hypothetical protein